MLWFTDDGAGAGCSSNARNVMMSVRPANGFWAVSNQNNVTPSENRSDRPSTGRPSACARRRPSPSCTVSRSAGRWSTVCP